MQAGRGHKGAKSRSGFKHKRGFEGGQMPLHRRVPKRGFHNLFREEFEVVNLDTLSERFEAGTEITPELLASAGIVSRGRRVKVLGRGDIDQGADGPRAQVQRQGGREDRRRRRHGRGAGVIMIDSLKNIFAVADLRKRVLFTLGLLAVYRVGGHIPTPGINPEALRAADAERDAAACSASTTCSRGRTCRR